MSRNSLPARCAGLALLFGILPGLASGANFGGEFRIGDTTYQVADAIAFPNHDDIVVVLSDHPLDRGKLAEDGKIDSLDFPGQR